MKLLLKKYYRYAIILAIPYLFIVISFFIPVKYDITTPGGLNKVESVITIDNQKTESGSFNTTFVYAHNRTSFLMYMIAGLNKKMIVEPTSETINYNSNENAQSGKIQKNVSIINSIIASYDLAQENYPDLNINLNKKYLGVIVYLLANEHTPNIKVGDIICKVNNQSFNSYLEFTTILSSELEKSQDITFTLWQDNTETEVSVKPIIDGQTLKFGFYGYDYYEIDQTTSEPQYELHKSYTEGPSGGLMQALAIYNALIPEDLSKGLKIAGTGTISANGEVGSIGGMYQKIITASFSKADVFFVLKNSDNAKEAYRSYQDLGCPKHLKIVEVTTLKEAVAYLYQLGD